MAIFESIVITIQPLMENFFFIYDVVLAYARPREIFA